MILNKPILTVALPVYDSKNIAWLAMESLCRQRDVSFEWELVVCEELLLNYCGEDFFMGYADRLRSIGCSHVKYIPLTEWVPLPRKWKLLGGESSKTSKIFILQASDCYSQPYRLLRTYKALIGGTFNWYQSTCGYFYHTDTGELIKYDHSTLGGRALKCTALNMGTLTSVARSLPYSEINKGVDGWFMGTIRNVKIYADNHKSWVLGIDTHGLNHISLRRGDRFKNIKPPFVPTSAQLKDVIPGDVAYRLSGMVNKPEGCYTQSVSAGHLRNALVDYTLFLHRRLLIKPGRETISTLVNEHVSSLNIPQTEVNNICTCDNSQYYRDIADMKHKFCRLCCGIKK